MRGFWRKVWWAVRRRQKEDELREELAFHVAQEAAERRASGDPEERAQLAARDLGNVALVVEDTRAAWGWARLEQRGRDVRYAVRTLRRQPVFALVALATLALGIGANAAVFSVVNAVLLRPLPYAQPGRLELITSRFTDIGSDRFWLSLPEFVDFKQHNQTFANAGAYSMTAANLGGSSPSRQVTALVTPDLLPTLGIVPHRGRAFAPDDSAPGAPPVAMLTAELWQRAFGGDERLVGQTIRLNDLSVEVIGILPPGFDIQDERVALLRPLPINPATLPANRGSHSLYVIGRLADHVTREQAAADIDRLLATWDTIAPGTHVPDPTVHPLQLVSLRDDVVGSVQRALFILQAAVAFVLLIACANLANILMARAEARRREYAVRTALGASRGRLFAQLATEGIVLTLPAAAIGVGLAWAGLRALIAVHPEAIPRTADVHLDGAVLAFTVMVAVGTGLVFALVPLAYLRRDLVSTAVREGGTRTTAGARVWVRSSLVVVQVAVAVTLVVGAGLLLRSFGNLMRVDMGFDRSQLSTFSVVLPIATYTAERRAAFHRELAARLQGIAGVDHVASILGLPPLRNVDANTTDFEHIPDNRPPGAQPAENVDFYQYVSAEYSATMKIALVAGRFFEPGDAAGPPRVVINEALARKFFPDRSPLGARMKPGLAPFVTLPWFTIVGVLQDVKQGGVAESAGTELYVLTDHVVTYGRFAPAQVHFAVRAAAPFEAIAPRMREAVQSLDAGLPVIGLRSMDEVIDAAVARPRFLTLLLGVFAGLALLLAAVGTYGVLAYLVTERRQEIGVRMALGADRGGILRLFLRRGLLLSAAGLGAGMVASVALGRVLGALLFDVAPHDPATLAAVAGLVSAVALVACAIPAWRATRLDPVAVLRES